MEKIKQVKEKIKQIFDKSKYWQWEPGKIYQKIDPEDMRYVNELAKEALSLIDEMEKEDKCCPLWDEEYNECECGLYRGEPK